MLKVTVLILVFVTFIRKNALAQLIADAKWCVVNDFEYQKCSDLVNAVNSRVKLNRPYSLQYLGKKYPDLPQLKCIKGTDQYDCMTKISTGEAALMQLETGLSYTAGEYYNMMPLVAEKYQPGTGDEGLNFYAVAVVKTSDPGININTLKGKKACIPGVGQAAGWIYPVSYLIQKGYMDIAQCNVPVKSAANYFGNTCAPDGLARYYNPFGNNPVTICDTCKGIGFAYCTCNDPYAGYAGAMDCLLSGNDIAFVRHTTLAQYLASANTSATLTKDDFQLVCTDGSRASVDSGSTCNWGRIPSHVVMTSAVLDAGTRSDYKDLLQLLSMDFGDGGNSIDLFQLFKSIQYGKHNLMFTDETLSFKDINSVAGGTRNTYYTWVVLPELQSQGQDLKSRNIFLNSCPIQQARWCVISAYEMMKCENMIMAFAARNLKPIVNCILGDGVEDCMTKIKLGDADLITLDAADVYIAGKKYGLVPIAAEDYSGTDKSGYYAVAVARRRFSYLTLFNLKQRRSCHASVMSAAGWVIPVDVLIQTGQINVLNCDAYLAVSQYFSKSCVPGVLDKYYNPHGTNPVSLCEACSTAGPRRCMRSDDELYYGSSGAFRCLTEVGGDISFVRHTTVRENTDGRNLADWARNRRSDDYELLCNDGTRKDIDSWDICNLGQLPSNAIMTADFKTANERNIYWTMLSYAQQFFDADTNPDFPMFDSMLNHKDLIFQDATVRLIPINSTSQNYVDYLGPEFVRAMQRMENIDCVTGSRATLLTPVNLSLISCTTLSIIVKLYVTVWL